MSIPLSAPDIGEAEIDAVVAVLRTSQLSLGPRMLEFEAAFAHLTSSPFAIAVSSGTAGLHLALLALQIQPGDEVIVPSFTFIAAANAVRYVGAAPVFVDIDNLTLNMTVAAVEQAITPRTRAILAVHTFGVPCPIAALTSLARTRNLFLVEDACEAIGALADGKAVGSFGHIGIFAFYPNKQITTGEGGMIVTSDARLARTMQALRNQGRDPDRAGAWLQHTHVGYNYRLSELACALGIVQLARLPEILARREQIARRYAGLLSANPHVVLPALDLPGNRISWFVFVIRLASSLTEADRDTVVEQMAEAGIATGRYFAPIHRQPAYAESGNTALPVTESEAARAIALPFFNRISDTEILEVVDTLTGILALLHQHGSS